MDENTMDLLINLGIQIPIVVAFIWFTMQLIATGTKAVEGIQSKFLEANRNILVSCEKQQDRILEYLSHRDEDYNESLEGLKTAVHELRTAVKEMNGSG